MKSSRSSKLPRFFWGVSLLALGMLFGADPFGISPLDDWLRPSADESPVSDDTLWTCGMHPEVLQEEPGSCPICHMDLVPVASGADPHEHGEQAGLWSCPMHPEVLEEQPGQCPICHMDLVPLEGGEPSASGSNEAAEPLYYRHPHDPSVTSLTPARDEMGMDFVPVYDGGGATIRLDGSLIQSMNVRTARAELRDVVHPIRTVGYLDYDQSGMVTVTTKFAGWIEKVHVNYLGEPVRKGQPLFEIYSPELVQTQQELLSARDFVRNMSEAPPESRRRAEALMEAARTRLRFWDISDGQVEAVLQTGKPVRTLTVTAPSSGVVMKRMDGMEGMATQPGMELFHLADLSSLWLSVEVFEDQLSWLDVGSEAEVTFSYFPGETFSGRVRYVEPHVTESTRTLGLRLEIPNRNGRLRSGMYGTVEFRPVAAESSVAVSSLAVLRTGERDLVVLALGEGRFRPQEVLLGAEGEGWVQILAGVAVGDEVVTSAQFLLDSESNLRAAVQKMIAARRVGEPGGTDAQ